MARAGLACARRFGDTRLRALRIAPSALALAVFLLLAPAAEAAQATIAWDAVADEAVAGYRLFFGPVGGEWPAPIDVGNVSSHVVTGLEEGAAYRAAVSAYDVLGQEGELSAELIFTASEVIDPGAGGSPGDDAGSVADPVVADPLIPEEPLLFADDFSDSGLRGDPSWMTVRGRWSGTRQRSFVSSGKRVDLSLVAEPGGHDFRSGRIEARAGFSKYYAKTPNAEIVFHYRDPAHYRYLRLTPTGLVLGQVGEFSGEPGGVKARRWLGLTARPWHRLRLDVENGALLRVYVDNRVEPAISHAFAAEGSGGVGLQTRRARSRFDDLAIWSDRVLK